MLGTLNEQWVLWQGSTKACHDPVRLRQSVRRLLDLDFDTLLVVDGISIPQETKDSIRELVDSFPD